MASQVALMVKNPPAKTGDIRDTGSSLDQEDLQQEMATHSSILAWKFSWVEEPDMLQTMGSQRVGYD